MAIEYLGHRVRLEDGVNVLSSYFAGVDCEEPVHYRQVRAGNMLAVFEGTYFIFSFYGQQYRAFHSIKMTCQVLM